MQNASATVETEGDKYSMGKFRGNWNASLVKPAFNAFAFLPTAPAMKPRVRLDEGCESSGEHEIEILGGEVLLEAPPSDADVLCSIKDRDNEYRGYISADGSCFNNMGHCIGYINVDSEEAGSAGEEYLGCLRRNTNICFIEDALDEVAGTLDLGLASIIDCDGSTVVELSRTSECTGRSGSYLGTFEEIDYNNMKVHGRCGVVWWDVMWCCVVCYHRSRIFIRK